MKQDFMDDETSLESLDVDSVADSLSMWIEQGTDKIKAIFDSGMVSGVLDTAKEIGDGLSKVFKVISLVRKSASIPDKLFIRKTERYCAGLVSIPAEKREQYAKRIGKKALNKDSVFILGVLNRIEELSKIDILVKLFEEKIYARIDDQTYRRMMLQVDRTMFSDILFLKDHICDDHIAITSVEEEDLITAGWLVFAGIDGGSATEHSKSLYLYTETAKQFCEIISRLF